MQISDLVCGQRKFLKYTINNTKVGTSSMPFFWQDNPTQDLTLSFMKDTWLHGCDYKHWRGLFRAVFVCKGEKRYALFCFLAPRHAMLSHCRWCHVEMSTKLVRIEGVLALNSMSLCCRAGNRFSFPHQRSLCLLLILRVRKLHLRLNTTRKPSKNVNKNFFLTSCRSSQCDCNYYTFPRINFPFTTMH